MAHLWNTASGKGTAVRSRVCRRRLTNSRIVVAGDYSLLATGTCFVGAEGMHTGELTVEVRTRENVTAIVILIAVEVSVSTGVVTLIAISIVAMRWDSPVCASGGETRRWKSVGRARDVMGILRNKADPSVEEFRAPKVVDADTRAMAPVLRLDLANPLVCGSEALFEKVGTIAARHSRPVSYTNRQIVRLDPPNCPSRVKPASFLLLPKKQQQLLDDHGSPGRPVDRLLWLCMARCDVFSRNQAAVSCGSTDDSWAGEGESGVDAGTYIRNQDHAGISIHVKYVGWNGLGRSREPNETRKRKRY